MRSRTIREGSVGLLILVGLAVFAGLVLWLRGWAFGNRSYKFIVNFDNVAGMKAGASVRYRGVTVGKISQIKATTNGVDATVEVSPADLLIPRNALFEANQAGLIGETAIDITPLKPLPSNAQSLNPLASNCNPELIICNKNRLKGNIGVSFDELLRNTIRLSTVYSDPAFFNNINTLTKNASVAASGAAQLTGELTLLTRSARQQLGSFSAAANSVSNAANQSTNQLGVAANRIGTTADQFGATAGQLNKLITSANDLVVTNRGTLVGTLDSVKQTSDQLRGLLGSLTTTANQANSTVSQLNSTVGKANIGAVVKNLETLSSNAAQASANLRDITTSFNNPTNITLLQQTLDSARSTFENTQKITSDLDELTGDPAFRENVKKLVNGLGKLVSSTEQLQQQVQVAETVEPVRAALNLAVTQRNSIPLATPSQPQVEPTTTKIQQQLVLFPPAPKKPLPQSIPQPFANNKSERREN
jgi:phospholipid/cholesterol/gamma-HCH transport system substrate-binding protein